MQIRELLAESKGAQEINGLPVMSLAQFVGQDDDVEEAVKGLGARQRTIDPEELKGYLGRVKSKTKAKSDKYKMPYVHGSSIAIKDESGKDFDLDALKSIITKRPAKIIKQNQKMEHSDGSTSIFVNIGLPALKGLAVNEDTGEFVIVDTCPGAGACQTYCYAMKGGYIQFKGSWESLSRMLNFLLNDPDGFASKLSGELEALQSKFPDTQIVVRWHDAGDFFSPEYLDLAFEVARSHPKIQFYAYTKLSSVAQSNMPPNFKMNFSQGAKPGEEKKINFVKTKHSKVVPKKLFFDLIARDGLKLEKDAKGRMQFRSPQELEQFKQRMAKTYSIDPKSIITYDQMMATKDSGKPTYNVIVMPGDGDDSANRGDVLGTYLLFH